jgi:hypothetical protein
LLGSSRLDSFSSAAQSPKQRSCSSNTLVQDAAYSTLVRGARRNLHTCIADVPLAVSHAEGVVARDCRSARARCRTFCQSDLLLAKGWGAVCPPCQRSCRGKPFSPRLCPFSRCKRKPMNAGAPNSRILSQLGPALMNFHGCAAAEAGEVVESAADVGRRLGRKSLRRPSSDANGDRRKQIKISVLPAAVENRAVPGHWEGDLLSGSKNSYTAPLAERHTRYVILATVANKDTRTVLSALIEQAKTLPNELLSP